MPDGFNDTIREMRMGAIPTKSEFECPLCGGMAHLRAGTLTTKPLNWLWMEAWCEDCGDVEKFDGVSEWPGAMLLMNSESKQFTLAENLQRIRRFVRKGLEIQALRLYRELYHTDLQQARNGIEELINEE